MLAEPCFQANCMKCVVIINDFRNKVRRHSFTLEDMRIKETSLLIISIRIQESGYLIWPVTGIDNIFGFDDYLIMFLRGIF